MIAERYVWTGNNKNADVIAELTVFVNEWIYM